MPKRIKRLLTSENIFVSSLLIASFFVRAFRIDKILNFYYDQGRDALVIWDLIHSHKFFLIGPTTGLPGIFRGPYYYYLIAPFYWLGRGNPVYPELMLIFTTVVALWLLYHLGKKIIGKEAGIIALVLGSFSFYISSSSRWLSNPTPMLLLSMVLVWAMIKVTEKKKWAWPVIAVVSGLSLFSFGSSGEFFYFPTLLVFLIWQWKTRPDAKNLILSIVLFCLTFAPLVLFDLKHDHILFKNFTGTFGMGSGSFSVPTLGFIAKRTGEYFDIFTNKLFLSINNTALVFLSVSAVIFLANIKKLWENTKSKIVIIMLLSPIAGLYFYHGNYEVLYDYYMTGYYLIFILLFAISLSLVWKNILGKIFIALFLAAFLFSNIPATKAKVTDGCDGPETICLSNQLAAIDWVYQNAGGRDFNVDEYVPPVIPYAYDYLYKWYGTVKYHKLPVDSQVTLLYTLYEVDPPHPERLTAWLERQKGIGRVIREQKFGGIMVQERERIVKK